MTQKSLPFTRQAEVDRATGFDRANLNCARLILQAGPKYGGLTRQWAERVIARLGTAGEKAALKDGNAVACE